MDYPPVLKKSDFVRRYQAGEFGNASPTWMALDEFRYNTRYGLYHLRNGKVAGGITHYKQTWGQAINLWVTKDYLQDWYVSEQVPLEVERALLLQGEVMETEKGLYLFSSTVLKPMRDALRERAESVYGILASFALRRALCPNSYEWLMELLRRYPGHVVEFSSYSRRWGTLPNFNTVVWEVRRY